MLTAEELRARRAVEKLTQKEFGERLGIGASYVNKLENGHVKPSKKIETQYDELYPKRLISITFKRGVECPECHSAKTPEKLSEPKDELDTIYRCKDCKHYFTLREAWNID